jgi:hypothetical protein
VSCSPLDIGCWLDWASQELKIILINLLDSILQAIASVLALIPAPSWSQNIGSLVANVGPEFWWMAEFFSLSTGISIMMSAMVIRFLVRRLPFIG